MTDRLANSQSSDPPDGSMLTATRLSENGRRGLPSAGPVITIFALPKPFGRDTDVIQRNAIRSWSRLQPEVEVLLIGDEAGIADTAAELGVRHAGGLEVNRQGTPLVNSAFEIA